MRFMSLEPGRVILLAMASVTASAALAQSNDQTTGHAVDPITVNGSADAAQMTPGPEIKGTIVARNGDRMKVKAADGTTSIIAVDNATLVKSSAGLFGSKRKLNADALLNGLPVTIKTMQSGNQLVARQIIFRGADLKIASMIRNGTDQRFEEQAAATEALRGRMGDIDKYNIKSTTNVYFDTNKAVLSEQAKAELCSAAAEAEKTENALMLVVGYTDSTGSEDYNQTLSEKRAGRVINYLQQACRWKPYRMLTPTGMAEADPLASNDTEEGKAQNRRVSVNILVSKSVDGL